MSFPSIAAGIEPIFPPTAKARDPLPSSQISIPLEEINYFSLQNQPAGLQTPFDAASTRLATGLQTPKTPNELEVSSPPRGVQAAPIMPSWRYPKMNKWRLLAACTIYFGNGLNDASVGALIPYIESHYHIGYAVVSLVFVTNAVGFILAAFLTQPTLRRLGRSKSGMVAEVAVIVGYIIIACTPPFGAVVFAFLLLGLGMAFQLALNNVWCANLANATVIVGIVQGLYGAGGLVGPIITTSLVSTGVLWSRFYVMALGIRIISFFLAGWAFHNYESEPTSILGASLDRIASRQREDAQIEQKQPHPLKKALANRITVFGALFIFAYQGGEVAISGWVISYLIDVRGGDPAKVGYVTSGFWAGITLGRFCLSHAASKIGEKIFVYFLGVGAIAFQLLVWLVPNVVGDAVAVAFIGLLLGPIYPCASTVLTRLLPMDIQMTAYGFIASAGSSGGAIAPLATGLLAQSTGSTEVLHPICIGLFAFMLICWTGLPKFVKRSE